MLQVRTIALRERILTSSSTSQKRSRFSHINFIETRIADKRPRPRTRRRGEERRGRPKEGARRVRDHKQQVGVELCKNAFIPSRSPRPRMVGRAIINSIIHTGRPTDRAKDRAASQPRSTRPPPERERPIDDRRRRVRDLPT